MKKFFAILAASALAATVNAQVYLGGSFGFGSVDNGWDDSESTYKIIPEIGYNLSNQWAIGIAFGYQKGECNFIDKYNYGQDVDTEVFSVNPYVRYTFLNSKYINTFIDGGIAIASVKDGGTDFEVGIRPGVAVNLSDKFSFVTHFGFLGFESFSPKGDDDNCSKFGLDLDGNNITFGLYYNF